MVSQRTKRELIGRGAMVLLAAILLSGAWGLVRAAQASSEHDAKILARMAPNSPAHRRYPHAAPLFYLFAGTLGLAGTLTLAAAVTPARFLYRIKHKPAVLWENPEPGTGVHRF